MDNSAIPVVPKLDENDLNHLNLNMNEPVLTTETESKDATSANSTLTLNSQTGSSDVKNVDSFPGTNTNLPHPNPEVIFPNSKTTISTPILSLSDKDRGSNTAELFQKKPTSKGGDYDEDDSTLLGQDEDFVDNGQGDPRRWPKRKKNIILFIIAAAGILGPISSTILYPAIPVIEKDLHTSAVLANGLVSVFIFFKGAAPLVWASYSDTFGTRRKIYLVSFTVFIITSAICGFAWNIWALMVLRGLQSCGASAVQSIGAGTISDIYDSHERGSSYGIFYIGPLVGPLLGPILGGFVTHYLGWRWIFWVLTIIGVILLLFIFFALPETSRRQTRSQALLQQPLLQRSAVPDSKKRFNPFSSLDLIKYPWVSLIQVYVCAVFAIIFVQNTLVPRSFEKLYHLTTADVGLVFLAPSAGFMIGSIIGGRYSDFVLAKYKALNGGISYPEMRLNSSWLGVVIIPISFLAYGWFVEFELPIFAPLTAMFFGGFSTYLAFNSASTYLVDAFPNRSASAIAVTNFFRGLSSAVASLISIPLEDALGVGWTYTLLVSITILSSSCLVLVYYRGPKWRETLNSKLFYQTLGDSA